VNVHKARVLLLAVLALAAGVAHADAWGRLYGSWSGRGTVSGMAAEVELEFRRTLDGLGRHLRFENRMTAEDGKLWVFRAEALYLCDATGACRGHWYDSRGMVLPLTVVSHDDRIVVDWGDATTERGRTSYRLAADGRLEITDDVLGKDGEWRPFGRVDAVHRAGP
jgi:hypothetical protein